MHKISSRISEILNKKLAPAVTEGSTVGTMDSASVRFFTALFAYNFVRK